MPRVVVTPDGGRGLERCRRFLFEKNPQAAARATETIKSHVRLLKIMPDLGRPHADFPGFRELFIPFGASGYVALYRHDLPADIVYILDFRHQKEVGC